MMERITAPEINQTLEKTMDRVCENHTPLVITREDKPAVVIMSLDNYQFWEKIKENVTLFPSIHFNDFHDIFLSNPKLIKYYLELILEISYHSHSLPNFQQLIEDVKRLIESIDETTYLLQSQKNAQRLLESIEELETGGGRKRELIEE